MSYKSGFPLLPNSAVHCIRSGKELRFAVIVKEVDGDAANVATNVSVTVDVGSCRSPAQSATIQRIEAPDGLKATTGIRFNGQTWDGSTDGLPIGKRDPGDPLHVFKGEYGKATITFFAPPASLNLVVLGCG